MGAAVVENVEVLNCPHCGSDAHLKTDASAGQLNKATGKPIPGSRSPWFWVKCSNKDCAASHVSQPSAEKAAAVWNARA